jgi:hypothetical protein
MFWSAFGAPKALKSPFDMFQISSPALMASAFPSVRPRGILKLYIWRNQMLFSKPKARPDRF